ncbi:hypothetical protein EDD17DRAFT_1047629 [Pisolithus thermaeus]|nr:hypothetical protein EDD17DRAFT_1047629 [Pisolithus thermaeus]
MSSQAEVVGDRSDYTISTGSVWWVFLLLGLGTYDDVSIGFSMATAVVTFINDALTYAFHTRFYTATPAAAAILLAEVLNTVSLCVLLYESGSRSAVPRTKRLLNTLIIYAVNRCLLTLLVVIAEVAVDVDKIVAWTMHH